MSTESATRTLGAAASLESLKKEAKRWRNALRDGDAAARERLRRVLPKAGSEIALREVQHALALEHGLDGWAALKAALADRALAKRSAAERADDFLRLAIDRQGGPLAAHMRSASGLDLAAQPRSRTDYNFVQYHNQTDSSSLHRRLVEMWEAVRKETNGHVATQVLAQNNNIPGSDPTPPTPFGWMFINLNTTVAGGLFNPTAQAWITTVMSAEGRYSVGFDAIQLDQANQTFQSAVPGGVILEP